MVLLMAISYFLARKTTREEEAHCSMVFGCCLANSWMGVKMLSRRGWLWRTAWGCCREQGMQSFCPPKKLQSSPPELLSPSTGQCWGWHLLREGSRPEQAQGAQGTPGWHLLLSSRAVPSAQGAWPPFLGAAQRGTTAQTSRMFSCFVMGRCCLRGVWKDYQFWVGLPNVQPDLAVTSQFEESKARMINKGWLMGALNTEPF